MTTFVLIPGAGGAGRVYWSDVAAALADRGHLGLPVEIAGDDPALGLPEYAAIVDDVIGEHDEVVLVAQSMGGFTVPMIDKLDRVSRIVFVNAMIPLPDETPGEWFTMTGSGEAMAASDQALGHEGGFDNPDAMDFYFLHDIPDGVKSAMADGDREPADTCFAQKCTFTAWPEVPIHVLVGADDRLFPANFQLRVARERLGIDAEVIPGGHLVAKSRPVELAEQLIACATDGVAGSRVAFDLADAAAELKRIVRGVGDDQLGAATVCDGWAVRDLLAHLYDLPRGFASVARHEQMPEPDQSRLPDDWREHIAAGLDELVPAWRDPGACTGEHTGAGVTLPRSEWAQVVLDELVVHAWDLSQATGQTFDPAERDVEVCTKFAESFADLGDGGPFAASRAVAADASPLERLIALTGREPGRR